MPRDSLTSRETNLAFATLPLALFPAASSLAPHRRNQIETTNRARTGRWSPFESSPGKLFTSRAVDYRFVVLSARSPPLPPFFLSFSLFLSQTFRRRHHRRRKIDRESDRWWKRSYTLCYVSFLLPFRNRVSSSLQFPRSSAKNWSRIRGSGRGGLWKRLYYILLHIVSLLFRSGVSIDISSVQFPRSLKNWSRI